MTDFYTAESIHARKRKKEEKLKHRMGAVAWQFTS
jgi:hypothetical protein